MDRFWPPFGRVAAIRPSIKVGGVVGSEEVHGLLVHSLQLVFVVEADDSRDECDINSSTIQSSSAKLEISKVISQAMN